MTLHPSFDGVRRECPGNRNRLNASISTASKGAIDGLTRALSNELAPRKIRANAIKPGVVETEGPDASHFLDAPQADPWRE